MAKATFADSVFINCPFDKQYWPLFEVILFTTLACGFWPRAAPEEVDSGDIRLSKIARIMGQSRYGIHDLSRTQLDKGSKLPRFNMPFELGIDWAFKHFGTPAQRKKKILILEERQHSVKICLSDCGGQDPIAHANSPDELLRAVRRFLIRGSGRKGIPGDLAIRTEYQKFTAMLPTLCKNAGLDPKHLDYVEYIGFARDWLKSSG